MVKSFKILSLSNRVFIKLALLIFIVPSLLYAQNDSSEQQNNKPVEKKEKKGIVREFLRVNKEASKNLDRAADILDKKISPKNPDLDTGERNKTQINFTMGGDFDDRGNIETNFRYGIQLHLPRFQQYWKVKFANQDEKRERGQSSMTREQRTRNTNDDIFLGVNFARNWNTVKFDYKPQIAFDSNLGLDHSVEASTEYQKGRFLIKPSLEVFGNHGEGLGSSSVLAFSFKLLRSVSLHQGNDARFVYSESDLQMNHLIGIGYSPNDRLGLSFNYFRSFVNPDGDGFGISAYGYYIASSYVIYRNVLAVELQPYIVYERTYNFERTNGALLNFKIKF